MKELNKKQKHRIRNSISKRKDVNNLTDIRTIIALVKNNLKWPTGITISKRIMTSEFSWQERLRWLNRIINYTGGRSESIEYLTILYNSAEKAKENLRVKGERVKGENNAFYNHGGKYSSYSRSNIKYKCKTENETSEAINKIRLKSTTTKRKNPHKENTKIEYYLNQGMSLEEAEIARSKRQTTFSKEKCILKYGEEKGIEVWNNRQEKWLKSHKRRNFSKISQTLFDSILSLLENKDLYDIYYATLDREDMKKYVNKEYTLKLDNITLKPDFICLNKMKVIEFDGDYWHSDRIANPTREHNRQKALLQNGYQVFRVKEKDYKNNKEEIIQQCIQFLTT